MPRQIEDDNTLPPRNSLLLSKTRRDSVQGRVSRRNSHCSIIEISDQVVLVEMMTDPATENHRQISHHDSLDLLTNIRQMEETQQRIQNTMARIRYPAVDKEHSPDKHLVTNRTTENQKIDSSDAIIKSDSVNCDNPVSAETAVANKIQELLKSVLKVGSRKSEPNKHLSKNTRFNDYKPMSKEVHETVNMNESGSETVFSEMRQSGGFRKSPL